jgi:hypothetical protein
MFELRKLVSIIEEIRHDGGPPPAQPLRVGAVAAVVANPMAGRFATAAELAAAMEALRPLGLDMSRRLLASLGGEAARIEAYGKGALVGAEGEFEHGALWHAPGGYAMREVLGGAKAIVPSTQKRCAVGGTLDVPLHHLNAAYVRSHFNAIEVRVADAPRAAELVLVLAMATGGRIHARMGGLQASEIQGEDGQR